MGPEYGLTIKDNGGGRQPKITFDQNGFVGVLSQRIEGR